MPVCLSAAPFEDIFQIWKSTFYAKSQLIAARNLENIGKVAWF
jgi:hypothetical protein